MVWIPGGEFSMGAMDPLGKDANVVGMQATTDSRPIHRVYVDGFWMDKTEVTNEQFKAFVKATNYVTLRSASRGRRTFRGRRPRTWSQARWCSLRPTMRCHSMIISSGGPTSMARTGATRMGPKAT